ncbi:MAG: hypothetical protein Q7R35_03075 [Elusimicrobiota bacterium]|nr:hypothetical protein [Elusimicrobiota bacterium]
MPTSDCLKTRFMEEARRNAAAAVAASATAEPAAAQEKRSEQPGIASDSWKMVSQGEGLRNAAINKVALVQYMDYAAGEGRDEALMLSTLKEKGWPESEVADAFRSFKLLHGQA